MISLVRKSSFKAVRMLPATVVLFVLTSPAFAVLVHKYTFNDGTANDSQGIEHGTLFGTNGSFSGGQLILNNTGEGSGAPGTAGAYLNLPNNLISNAALNGGTNSVTVEMWITMLQNRDWAAAFTAGTSRLGEDVSSTDNGDAPYIQIIPRTGDGGQGNDLRVTTNSYAGPEGFVDDLGAGNGTDLQVGVKEHIVSVFDQSGGVPGTLTVYRNGVLMGSSPMAANLDLTTFQRADFTGTDHNIWLGRSQWPDALVDASYDEVRIYNSPLDQTAVTASFQAGPDPVPLPVLRVNRATGEVTFANPAGPSSPFNLKSYAITSAGGQLNVAGWASIDAGNLFDTDGTWTTSSLTSTNIAEEVTSGTLDGGTIGGGTSKSIGSTWLRTPFAADLAFTYALNGGATGSGFVEYTGAVPTRSDLNGDGQITVTDWQSFYPNHGKLFTGEMAVAAYLKGDLDGDLDNDYSDFLIFKADYDVANGAGSFELMAGVPEPAALLISLMGVAIVGCLRRR
jgi:hypothetical protein